MLKLQKWKHLLYISFDGAEQSITKPPTVQQSNRAKPILVILFKGEFTVTMHSGRCNNAQWAL